MSQSSPRLEVFSKILKYDAQVPRYTSYPTAPHFSSAVDGKIYHDWLKDLPEDEPLSLYFHIPFCQQMCWYCGCYTKITKRYAPVEDYAHLLIREIKIIADIFSQKRKVAHIHFGGGSPTILLPETFTKIMEAVQKNFVISKDAEIAIEVDPRSVNEEKIMNYAQMGVNRASLGVQDFNLEVQRAINREQPFDLVYDVVKNFRKHGINDINLDLIYGLPKQNLEGMKRNIDFALLLNPTRFALFSYAHVPWMKKHMRLINESEMPSAMEKLEIYEAAAQKLKEAGFVAIGLDHFAKEDDMLNKVFLQKNMRRNFQGYSSDRAENIIGFGASSIGYLSSSGYVQNISDFGEYEKKILANELPISKGIKITNEDRMRKKIIDELMCYMSVDLAQISAEFGLPQNYFAQEIEYLRDLQKDNLVKFENNKIEINAEAPQIARVVSSFFDEFFLRDENKKHSKIA